MNGVKSILKFYKKSSIPSANIFIRSAFIREKSAIDRTIYVGFRFPTSYNLSTSLINGVIIRYYHGSQNTTIDSLRASKDKENAIAVNFDSEEELNMVSNENIKQVSVDDVVTKAAGLFESIEGIDFRLKPRQEKLFRKIISQQLSYHNYWIKAIWKRPELLKYNHTAEDLIGLIDFAISGLQLSNSKAFALLNVIPQDLINRLQPDAMSPSNHNNDEYTNSLDVTTALLNWHGFCERYDLDAVDTLASVPEILYVPTEHWTERISELSEYFSNSRHIPSLIQNNAATVLLEGFPSLKRKIEYLVKVMHVDVKDIANCKALSTDFDEIKKRFLFLDRAGLYRHPVPNDVGSTKSASPSLSKIAQTPANKFIQRVVVPAGGVDLTVEEFEAFVRGLTPEDLSRNRFENPNSTGYEELIDQEEEENWYAEHGYDAPHIKEDIAEARKNRKGYIE